jgi:hypothetical protein
MEKTRECSCREKRGFLLRPFGSTRHQTSAEMDFYPIHQFIQSDGIIKPRIHIRTVIVLYPVSEHGQMLNLNELDWIEGVTQEDYSTRSENAEVFFKNLEQHLLEQIAAASYVVGCVAWFTLPRVWTALTTKRAASILVQKEDWLRNDFDEKGRSVGAKSDLFSKISQLPRFNSRWFDFDNRLSFGDGWERDGDGWSSIEKLILDPVRCVGPSSKDRTANHPRMHHKFLVFCRPEKKAEDQYGTPRWVAHPYAVWTGSFNVTSNATRSFENALLLRDELIAAAYMKEWAQLMAFSEPLNWTSEQLDGDLDFNGFWAH